MGIIGRDRVVHRRTKKQIAIDTNMKMDIFLGSNVGFNPVVKVPDKLVADNTKFALTSKGMQANLGKEPIAMSMRCRKILALILQGKTSANELAPSFKDVGVSASAILVELRDLENRGLISPLD